MGRTEMCPEERVPLTRLRPFQRAPPHALRPVVISCCCNPIYSLCTRHAFVADTTSICGFLSAYTISRASHYRNTCRHSMLSPTLSITSSTTTTVCSAPFPDSLLSLLRVGGGGVGLVQHLIRRVGALLLHVFSVRYQSFKKRRIAHHRQSTSAHLHHWALGQP